jgi:hypothetical protein
MQPATSSNASSSGDPLLHALLSPFRSRCAMEEDLMPHVNRDLTEFKFPEQTACCMPLFNSATKKTQFGIY